MIVTGAQLFQRKSNYTEPANDGNCRFVVPGRFVGSEDSVMDPKKRETRSPTDSECQRFIRPALRLNPRTETSLGCVDCWHSRVNSDDRYFVLLIQCRLPRGYRVSFRKDAAASGVLVSAGWLIMLMWERFGYCISLFSFVSCQDYGSR